MMLITTHSHSMLQLVLLTVMSLRSIRKVRKVLHIHPKVKYIKTVLVPRLQLIFFDKSETPDEVDEESKSDDCVSETTAEEQPFAQKNFSNALDTIETSKY